MINKLSQRKIDRIVRRFDYDWLARLASEVLSPLPTVAVLLLVVAWRSAPSAHDGLRWGILASLFAALLPFLYVLQGVRQRRLTDRHVRVREQRPLPLLVAIGSVLVGLGLLVMWKAPQDLVALTAAMAVGLGSSLAVTLFWKLSIHTAVVAGAVVILVLVFGPALAILAPLVGLAGWARVRLGDHTRPQVLVGAALGASVAAVVFSLLR